MACCLGIGQGRPFNPLKRCPSLFPAAAYSRSRPSCTAWMSRAALSSADRRCCGRWSLLQRRTRYSDAGVMAQLETGCAAAAESGAAPGVWKWLGVGGGWQRVRPAPCAPAPGPGSPTPLATPPPPHRCAPRRAGAAVLCLCLSQTRPVCRATAAHRCTQGQVRRTGEPYVAHCIETALIVEDLLSPTEEDSRWASPGRGLVGGKTPA